MKALKHQMVTGPRDGPRHFVSLPNLRCSPVTPEERLRRLIGEASDELCQVVDGNLDFVVRVAERDDDVDKLLLLVNFVLASARRSFDELCIAHRRLEEDLAVARNMQQNLLPQSLPCARNLRVATEFIPASAVGGDFFDFLHYPRRGLHAGTIADVSGKGAAAAIYAALTSGMLRSVLQEELKPSELLERLNRDLFVRAPDAQFVALTYFTWNDEQLLLEICNSGLPEPVMFRNGSVRSLDVHGIPLGLFPNSNYETMRLQCRPGDTFLFYTDGIVDSSDAHGKEFGTARLAEVVLDHSDSNANEIVKAVADEVETHTGSESQVDDQTIIVLKVCEPTSDL